MKNPATLLSAVMIFLFQFTASAQTQYPCSNVSSFDCIDTMINGNTCVDTIPSDAILVDSYYGSDAFPDVCFYVCANATFQLGVEFHNGGDIVYVEPGGVAYIDMNECCIVARAPSAVYLEDQSDGSHVICEPGVAVYYLGVLIPNYCDSLNTGCDQILFDYTYAPFACAVGIDETQQLASLFEVYPNPATDRAHISFRNQNVSVTEIVLLTAEGKEVLKMITDPDQNEFVLNLSHCTAGFYFVRMKSDRGLMLRQLVVR